VVDPTTGEIIAGTLNKDRDGFLVARNLFAEMAGHSALSTNTCLAVVATNARLDKARARRVAIMGHDGIARAIVPVHTLADGDTVFCLATGAVEADTSHVGTLAAEVISRAIVKGAKAALSAYGFAGYQEIKERFNRPKGR
jgi:L-aminopeptidase/D-esterase-like protein